MAALVISNHIRLTKHNRRPLVRSLATPTFTRRLAAALAFLVFAGFAAAQEAPLKVAVYDAPPYGHVEPDGSIDGVSVDLWRRAAESLGREYHLVPVTQMEEVLKGLERRDYDAAIGAITITPLKLARVDFSYPTHRSGAAIAVRADTGPMAALASYGSVLGELAPSSRSLSRFLSSWALRCGWPSGQCGLTATSRLSTPCATASTGRS